MNSVVRNLIAVCVVAVPLLASAGDKKSQYLIIAPHTPEECLAAIDEVNASKQLDKWDFGCMDGDHTGYRTVTADSKDAALAMVGAAHKSKARVVELSKFTPEQVKSLHKK
jgi:hypothetical protein